MMNHSEKERTCSKIAGRYGSSSVVRRSSTSPPWKAGNVVGLYLGASPSFPAQRLRYRLDLTDGDSLAVALGGCGPVTMSSTQALMEEPGTVSGLDPAEQVGNQYHLNASQSARSAARRGFERHVVLLQGPKGLRRTPRARTGGRRGIRSPLQKASNFYYDQEDLVRETVRPA